jgi:DNA-binding protein Fis
VGPLLPVGGNGTSGAEIASLKIEDVETAHLRKVVNLNHGNQPHTDETISWVISTLRNKIEKYGIDVEEYK